MERKDLTKAEQAIVNEYTDRTDAIVYSTGSEWIISTPEDDYRYESKEALLQDIRYSLTEMNKERQHEETEREVKQMKAYKQDVIKAVVKAAESHKIVSLKKAANEAKVERLNRHEVDEVMNAALKALPSYKAVEIYDSKADFGKRSRFGVLHFIDKTVEFDW